jgi:cadmium resistance protein CadD (predicted permease)
MSNLLLLLLAIFVGVGLMVVLGERFAKPADPQQMRKLQRWLVPLIGIMLVLSVADYFFTH